MANWAFKSTLSVTYAVRQPAYLDGNLYFIDNQYTSGSNNPTHNPAGDVFEYDPVAETQTSIFDASALTDHLKTCSLAAFRGDLYMALVLDHGATIEGAVLRWDGTPGDWTEVYSTGETNVGDRYVRLYADAGQMVYIGRQFTSAPDGCDVAYTTNGADWSAGSISENPAEPGNGFFSEFDDTVYWPLGFYDNFCTGVSGSNCSDNDVFAWGGTSFSVFAESPSRLLTQSSPNGNVHFGGADNVYKMPADMSSSAVLDADIGAAYLLNSIAAALGVENLGTTTKIYEYNNTLDQWDLLDELSLSGGVTPSFSAIAVWLANGASNTGLLIGNNSDSGNWEVWERDEAFPTSGIDYALTHSGGGVPGAVLI